VRIPKEYRVDSDEVYIEKIGDTLVLKPKSKNNLDDLFDALNALDT
jgi:antitoxin VapB